MRRLVTILGSMAVVLITALLLLPWWLGLALSTIGPSFGLTFGAYARDGYGRFHLENVRYQRHAVTVDVRDVESDTPVVCLWRRIVRKPGEITAGSWSVDVQRSTSPGTPAANSGWTRLRATLEMVADRLAHWAPRVSANAGSVAWPGGGLSLSAVRWQHRQLQASAVTYGSLTGDVTVRTPRAQAWPVIVATPDKRGGAELLTESGSVRGSVEWWGQKAALSAQFADHGWLPSEAALVSEKWDIAGDAIKLGGHYERIRGAGKVQWRQGDLTADLDVSGDPLNGSQAPPISIKLHGRGHDGEFVVETLDVKIPGVEANLSDPVIIDRHGKLKSGPSRITFSADLSAQPWLQARGKARGTGTISAAETGVAAIEFSVDADRLAVNEVEAKRVEANGRFAWPNLEIRRGRLIAMDGNEVALHGGWNFRDRELAGAEVTGVIGRATIARWLPAYPNFKTATVSARGQGRWPDLQHEGRLDAIDLQFPQLNPVAAQVEWHGAGFVVTEFAATAAAGASTIKAAGSVDRERLSVTQFSFANGGTERWRLVQPFSLAWRPQLQLQRVSLQGPDTAVDATLTWGESGRVALDARNVDARWFREFVALRSTSWKIDELQLKGAWAKGPLDFTLNARASVALGNERTGQVALQARGGAEGLEILSLRGTEGTGVIMDLTGKLPVTLRPTQSPLVRVDTAAPLVLNAATAPNPKFWDEVSRLSGVEIARPEVKARVEGSLDRPTGQVRLTADRLAAVPGKYKFEWPKIEHLDVQLTANPDGVNLETFSVSVDGQEVRARGTLPVSGEHWREFAESPKAVLRRGNLRIEVPNAEIAAIAHHFPEYFAPKGKLQLDLAFKPDETITGFLKITDATSRPLGPLGVLQEVNADVEFAGRSVNLRAVTARMGGQLVRLQGTAELPPREEPQLNFALKGDNLPFVRRTGLLLRGDLDLKLRSARGRTAIQGDVRLRDSLFLADLASLIPTGAKETARRPPYFSVEAVPLNSWTLDVSVQGERFLRLRTPVFNGTASARFRLGGTLGVPRATGEAVIDEGNIRLPFANFEVRQGQVRLTPEQPEPQLLVNATTRRYGYDLRLELTGAASAPNLTFSSSPPLEAEQVLLMVMAGEAPHNEVATTDRQRVARFGAFFGQSILGSLGGDSAGADRLTISSGENISAQGRETYSIEYKLNDKWSLTGEYDEFDDYYGGLKWRFYEKGGRKTDEKK